MKRIFIISLLLLGSITISCSPKGIATKPKMEQFYYTVEGQKYVLRSYTKTENVIGHAGSALPLQVFVNLPINTAGIMTTLSLNEQVNKIIPICVMFGASNTVSGTVADIQSIYYGAVRGNVPNFDTYDQLPSLSKTIPMSEMVLNTDNNNYRYGVKYSQTVYQDKDFIDPTGGITFRFDRNLGNALTDQPNGASPVTLPAGNYRATFTFIYFELVT